MEVWRWLFLIEGVLTIALATLIAFVLPNKINSLPHGFTQIEQEWLVWNFEEDQGQQDNADEISAMKGTSKAITDVKTWLLMATLYTVYIAAAVSNFFPSVVATLVYGRNETYALTAPSYVLCMIAMVINGFHSDRKQERYWHIICPMLICLAANIIAVATLNTAARLWCSYLYGSSPRYLPAFLVNLAASALAILAATATRMYLRRENQKLDMGVDTGRNGPTEAQKAAGFRYTL